MYGSSLISPSRNTSTPRLPLASISRRFRPRPRMRPRACTQLPPSRNSSILQLEVLSRSAPTCRAVTADRFGPAVARPPRPLAPTAMLNVASGSAPNRPPSPSVERLHMPPYDLHVLLRHRLLPQPHGFEGLGLPEIDPGAHDRASAHAKSQPADCSAATPLPSPWRSEPPEHDHGFADVNSSDRSRTPTCRTPPSGARRRHLDSLVTAIGSSQEPGRVNHPLDLRIDQFP